MFSFTCSLQPSNFRSNGSNLLFKYSMPVITDMSILPWNFTLLRRSRSSKCVSYSPFISARDDSMEYFLVSVMPFCSKSSNLRRYLNFSRSSSSLVICG